MTEAQLKLAEAELARAEEAARLRARLRQAEVEKKKANEVAKEIDRFILQSVETQKLTDTKSPTSIPSPPRPIALPLPAPA